ncbi:MAG: hypothetical protein AABY33_05890 [Pseudomonadota bacterium]
MGESFVERKIFDTTLKKRLERLFSAVDQTGEARFVYAVESDKDGSKLTVDGMFYKKELNDKFIEEFSSSPIGVELELEKRNYSNRETNPISERFLVKLSNPSQRDDIVKQLSIVLKETLESSGKEVPKLIENFSRGDFDKTSGEALPIRGNGHNSPMIVRQYDKLPQGQRDFVTYPSTYGRG